MIDNLSTLPPEIARNRILNTAQAAAFLSLSIPHFRRLYRSGAIPAPIHLTVRRLGWRAGTLIDWLEERQSRTVAV